MDTPHFIFRLVDPFRKRIPSSPPVFKRCSSLPEPAGAGPSLHFRSPSYPVFSRRAGGLAPPRALTVRKTKRAVRVFTQHSTSKQQHNLYFPLPKTAKQGTITDGAEFFCCVGGCFARIDLRGVPAPRRLPLFCFPRLLLYLIFFRLTSLYFYQTIWENARRGPGEKTPGADNSPPPGFYSAFYQPQLKGQEKL